jgi:hypothetical protein
VTVIRGVTVTAKTNLELIQEAAERTAERIQNDPVYAKQFFRAIMGPPRRVLEGAERDHMLTVFRLLEPFETSNNQRSFTEEYRHANKVYHVNYFEGEIEVEELLDEES